MKTIVEGRERVAKTWGFPKPKDTDYRLLKYLISTDCEDGTLLHNVVTGELVLLCAEEAALLEHLPAPFTETMTELIAHHFLVPVDFDEHKSVLQLRKLLRVMQRSSNITGYTILPTTACNARCFYCYEAEYPRHTMTEETAHKLVEYMDAHKGDAKQIGLGWFGGEPMLGVARIDQICSELQERGIEYTSSMISNGYLFTEELAKRAKEVWKLTNIQITLDGTEEIYNRVKSYAGVKDNPYYRVLNNIRFLLNNEIRVSVRMNLDRHNADNLRLLVDELAERFRKDKLFSVYTWVLFDDEGYDPVHHTEDDNRELEDLRVSLDSHIEKQGFSNPKREGLPGLKVNWCMADNGVSLLVNPLGEFGKCEHYSYDHLVGGLSEPTLNSEELARWRETKEKTICKDCFLYPNCMMLQLCPNERKCFPNVMKDTEERYRESMKRVYAEKQGGDAENGAEKGVLDSEC